MLKSTGVNASREGLLRGGGVPKRLVENNLEDDQFGQTPNCQGET